MTLSAATRSQLQRVNDPSGVLLFLRIDSPSFIDAVRVVRDSRNRDVAGETYVALPIEITMPQDVPKEQARAQIEMDNIGRDILSELEALPVGQALNVTMFVSSRATPEVIDWSFTGAMSKGQANYAKVVITISDDALMRMPIVLLRYDPETAPGLFTG